MSGKKVSEETVNELFEIILSLETIEDCRLLFEDLCTYKEKSSKYRLAPASERFYDKHRHKRYSDDRKTYCAV